ncbi:protein of unknown function [Streptomyces sp. KY75]|nr:protein of unknown function [Streptomyces sp. KY75]CAD5988157.1 protein of unknown function [Streptomyces sp. KY70]
MGGRKACLRRLSGSLDTPVSDCQGHGNSGIRTGPRLRLTGPPPHRRAPDSPRRNPK